MYVAHWNIFMVNKSDLQQNKKMWDYKLFLFVYRLVID